MLRHIVIRSLMIIPTLLIVSIVAFILSMSTPGDEVNQALALEGVTLDDDRISVTNYNSQYNKKAKQLGKNKPPFYFTIQPSNYPSYKEWSDINIYDREDIKRLIKSNIPLESAMGYIQAIGEFENKYFDAKDTLSANFKTDWKQSIALLRKPEQLTSIRKEIIYLANEYQDTPHIEDITEILTLIPLDGKNSTWHLPSLRWHGINNQYHSWISSFITGDFGMSILDAQPVFTKIRSAMNWTVLLILMNLVLSLLISIPLSILSAYYANSRLDRWISGLSLAVYSVPVFWMATLLIVYFTTDTYSKWLDLFPSPASFYSESETGLFSLLSKYFGRLILPVICISLKDIAYLTRVIRADLIKESTKDYATTLKAKGVSNWNAMWKHILPNSMISTITIIISNIPLALAGGLIIEVIFNIPGMGRLMYSSIIQSDWNVVYAILMLISLVTVVFYLIGDVLYTFLNPKVSYSNDE
ncbi:MAG: ABC transporter permease [Saprospiraceae bacterium]|nr:ABC transporter permease [Saprospiraceae bacterium]